MLGSRVGASSDTLPTAPIIKPNTSGMISVTGTLGAENANELVSLTVYKTTAGTAGISSQTAGTLNWYDQVMTNENGEYTFTFKMTGDRATNYSFSITTDEIVVPAKDFVFYPETEVTVIENSIETAKETSNAAAVDSLISTYKDYLQLDMADYSALGTGETLPSADQLAVCTNILEADVSDVEKFKQAFEDCSKVKVLNKEADPTYYENEMLAFIKTDAKTAAGYFVNYTTDKTEIITGMMANDDFKTKADIISYFNEKILPKEANKANLWPEMQSLVLSMATENSVDLTAYNALSNSYGNNQSLVFQSMLDTQNYTTCAQIISAFNTAVANTPVPKRTTEGSGGSSSVGGGSMVGIPAPAVPQMAFPDIGGVEWAKDSIKKLFTKGVVSGDEKGNFNPYANVTRAQYIKMIVSAVDMKFNGQESSFADVQPGDWYYEYVVTASSSGLVSGIDANNFGPDMPITRQDAATMISRAASIKGITLDAERDVEISDKEQISDYAKEAVETLYASNLLNGVGDGRFAPQDNMTRAQAAVIIANFLDRLEGLN